MLKFRSLENSFKELADDLARSRFFRTLFSQRDSESVLRRIEQPKVFNIASRVWAYAIIIIIAGFFVQRIGYYFDWISKISRNKQVYSLTKNRVVWDVHYGDSPVCRGVDCFLTADYPSSKYERHMVLPAPPAPLNGYKQGQLIYLRTNLIVPEILLHSREPIAFQSLYIWAKKYEFFISGKILDEGSSDTIVASIPRESIGKNGELNLAFRIDPGTLPYQGITHRGEVLIGARSVLKQGAYQALEIKTTYYLWFLIPKLVFLMIFCVLYAAVFQHKEIFYVIIYGFLVACSDYVKTDYSSELFQSVALQGRVLYLVFDVCAQAVLILFIHEYFRRHSPKLRAFLRLGVFSSIALSIVYLSSHDFQRWMLDKNWIYVSREILRCIGLVYGVCEGLMTCLYLAKSEKSRIRFISCLLMTIFFVTSLTFASVQYVDHRSTDSYGIISLIFDLVFFMSISSVVAAEFGVAVTQKNFIQSAFGKYLDPSLVDQMIKTRTALPAESRAITVISCDIRSFATMGEVYPADQVFEMLRQYRDVIVGVIRAHGGFVEKFVGDGIMAIWGAPQLTLDHALRAVEASIDMRKSLRALNAKRRAANQFEISFGIGIATGQALVGEITGSDKTDYTAVGDVVNLAARVESQNKETGTDILLTDEVLRNVSDVAVVECCGDFKVKGKEIQVKLYKLIGIFDRDGIYQCHDEMWELGLIPPARAGLVFGAGKNLKTQDYKTKNAA